MARDREALSEVDLSAADLEFVDNALESQVRLAAAELGAFLNVPADTGSISRACFSELYGSDRSTCPSDATPPPTSSGAFGVDYETEIWSSAQSSPTYKAIVFRFLSTSRFLVRPGGLVPATA